MTWKVVAQMVYMVTFNLNAPPEPRLPLFDPDFVQQQYSSYDAVVNAIKSVGAWARIQHGLWLVANDKISAAAIRDNVWNTTMRTGDFLLVMRVQKDWGAYNFDENVVKWLAEVKF